MTATAASTLQQDERGLDTNDAVAEPAKLFVAPAVSRATATMNATVNLHDAPDRPREEVRDVAVSERHLPLEATQSTPPRSACYSASSEGVARAAYGDCS
jgi:hypothetical protein